MLATLGNIYGKLRRYNQARTVLRKLMRDSMTKYVPPLALAALYLGLEEDDNALKWLEKAKQTKDIYLVYTNVMPIFTDLRERLSLPFRLAL